MYFISFTKGLRSSGARDVYASAIVRLVCTHVEMRRLQHLTALKDSPAVGIFTCSPSMTRDTDQS